MSHVNHDKKKLLSRVRRIQGQMTALEKAIDSDADCGDVLVQIAAVKGAMHGLMIKVMTGHLSEHIVAEADPIKRTSEAASLIDLLHRYSK